MALIALGCAGLLTSCSDSPGSTAGTTTAPSPASAPSASASPLESNSPSTVKTQKARTTPTSPAASAAPAGQPVIAAGQVFAFIDSVDLVKRTVTYDQAQFLTGDAAQNAAREDKVEAPGARDYYIRNVNTLLRTVPVTAKATIYGSIGLAEQMELTAKTLEDLRFYADLDQSAATPFWITVDDNGQITRIEEQFIP